MRSETGSFSGQGPLVILVTGLPATGKTTVARRIAERFRLPLASKDDYKEMLFDTLGWSDRDWSRRLSQAAIGALHLFLASQVWAGRSCIVECNFSAPAVKDLRALQRAYPFRPFQIVCRTEGEVLLERFARRVGQRHAGHGDEALLDELEPQLLAGGYEPLAIGGAFWEIDTTDFDTVDYDGLFNAIAGKLGAI